MNIYIEIDVGKRHNCHKTQFVLIPTGVFSFTILFSSIFLYLVLIGS